MKDGAQGPLDNLDHIHAPDDYSPQPLVADIGLGNTQLTATEEPNWQVPSPGAPVAATIVGYGDNSGSPSTGYRGSGQRRQGSADATYYYQGANQNVDPGIGAWYVLVDADLTHSAACWGDEGGPAIKDSAVFGVISNVADPRNCDNTNLTYVTALDDSAPAGDTSKPENMSNRAWMNWAVQKICGKTANASPATSGGTIQQSNAVSPPHEVTDPTDVELNAQYYCEWRGQGPDCTEKVHPGQKVTFTAVADPPKALEDGTVVTFEFVGWESKNGNYCHCSDPGLDSPPNPCILDYDVIGTNAPWPFRESDTDDCGAVFQPIPVWQEG